MTRNRHGWLLEQLPTALAEPMYPRDPSVTYLGIGDFMCIFEDIANSVEDEIDGLSSYFDPAVAPPGFVRWMGRWLGIDIAPTMTPSQQVALLGAAGAALAWRSTATGLRLLLEAFTGGEVVVTDSGGVVVPGTERIGRREVTVRIATQGMLDRNEVLGLIRNEVPPDAVVTLDVGDDTGAGDDPATVDPAPPSEEESDL